jgi:hypothetical protein
MVNLRPSRIFKGIFETHISTRNRKNFAESDVLGTWHGCVYHWRLNHTAAPTHFHGPLKDGAGAHVTVSLHGEGTALR